VEHEIRGGVWDGLTGFAVDEWVGVRVGFVEFGDDLAVEGTRRR